MNANTNKAKVNKSRHLSVYQFFEILQLEYLVAELRMRIYPKPEDKAYWGKIMDGKKRKVESIAVSNQLPSIFDDDDMLSAFKKRIYNIKGAPTFIYTNDEQKEKQEPIDLVYYYYKGTEVRFEHDCEVKIGTIISYIPYYPTIKVSLQTGEEIQLSTETVSRIL